MITDAFDTTEPIISLEDFYGKQQHIVDTCIVTFSKEIYQELQTNFICNKVAELNCANGTMPIYTFTYKDKTLAMYMSPIGSMAAAQNMIEVNWLIGATNFIMFGSCGSLNKQVTANKFIIPTEAYREEGMSYHYAPPSDYITIKNANTLATIFDTLHIPYVKGRIWTTEAMLRETKAKVETRQNEGCIAVEMEVAGVQAVCDYYGFQLYDFLESGDVLSEDAYEVEGLNKANHSLDKLYIALEVAMIIENRK